MARVIFGACHSLSISLKVSLIVGSSLQPASPIRISLQDQLTIVEFTSSDMASRGDVQTLREDLDAALEESDVGLVVDCEKLTGNINSFYLGTLVGVAKAARRVRKEFAVCGLQGAMQSAYELARISSEVPAYEDTASAIASLGIPDPATMVRTVQPVRRNLTETKKRSKKKAVKTAKATTPQEESFGESFFDVEEHGPKLAMAGGLFAVAMLVILGWSFGSSLYAMIPSSAADMELTLTGRVSYMNRGAVADDAGALVVAWPQGASPQQSLTKDDLADLAESGSSDDGVVFATRAGKDGSYTLQVQGKTQAELLNVLVVSNNLKEKSTNNSTVSSLDRLFSDPTEVVGKRGHELGFVVIENAVPKYDVTLSPRYVVQ